MRLFLLFMPAVLFAQGITVTPANPAASVGSSITISTDRPALFTLSGAGSISTSYGNSTVYSAPASITPQHVMNGCMVLPSDSVYNTRIDQLPVHASSASWTPWMTSSYGLLLSYQWGTNVIDSSTPLAPQFFHYSGQLNGTGFPALPLSNRKRETGSYAMDGNNDHHVLSINRQTCQFYETYQDGVAVAGCPRCTAASGWTYSSSAYQQPGAGDGGGTTDAAGLPLAPLTVHLSEIQARSVNHALRFTSCLGCIAHSALWPAVSSTGWGPSTAPPMGARFRLKASFDVSSYPPAAQIVLMAMKRYGLFLADVGMQGQITFGSDVTENPSVVQQLSSIAGITWSNFEAVDESAFVLSQSSNAVNPNNPYQAPANYALLTITDAANANNSVRIPVAIQPVTIGTPDPVVTVQAGTQPFKLPYWVNGTSNQSVTWSITPSEGAGTIADDGTYTPPSSVNGVLQAEVTATSSADPTASTSVQLNLIPAGPIRIDSGSSTGGQDESGNLWLPDLGFETGGYADVNDSYPVDAWGNVPDASVFQTYKYTWGDDIVYKFHVPNGNYRVGLMLGIGGVTGKYYTGTWDNGLVWGGLNLEAQGQTANRNWNLGIPANFQGRTPETVFIPAKVTDTTLTIAIRATTGPTGHSAPIINGLMVTPDASSPHFAIDNQQIRLVTPGNSLQLYPVDWYTGSTDVNWSILQGPGTLTQSGLYVAPLNITVPQWVIVRVHGVQSNAIGTLTLMVPTPGSNVTLPN